MVPVSSINNIHGGGGVLNKYVFGRFPNRLRAMAGDTGATHSRQFKS
jgi:hypothetical protein